MNNNDLQLSYQKPFALYVHIPFCLGKCNYCDFYSERYSHYALEGFYQGIQREIELYASLIEYPVLKTIYIGGGTPSLIKPACLAGLIEKIRQHFDITMVKEISMEANPGSITKDSLLKYKELGINRISLGVQSFDDNELSFLGRKHTVKQTLKAVELLQEVFQNYNLDLIFAIPGQSLKSWQGTLKQALSFQPPHLSIYNLQIEEGTPLANMLEEGEIKVIDNNLDAEMYLLARELFNLNDYKQYEISNFSRRGFDSIHNQIYWHYQPYLGIGPAAASFDGRIRFINKADLQRYINSLTDSVLPIENIERLSTEEQISEMIFMALRLIDGISLAKFADRFAVDLLKLYQLEVNDCLSEGFIEIKDGHIRLTEKGLLLGNEVFMKFLK